MNAGQRRKLARSLPRVGDLVSFYSGPNRHHGVVVADRNVFRREYAVKVGADKWAVKAGLLTIVRRFEP